MPSIREGLQRSRPSVGWNAGTERTKNIWQSGARRVGVVVNLLRTNDRSIGELVTSAQSMDWIGRMPTIELTQGKKSRVSWFDYKRISQFKWYAHYDPKTKSFYAARSSGGRRNKRNLWMHREVLNMKSGKVDRRHVDHLNHDTLDNRRSNLRAVTHRENHENRQHHSMWGVGISRDRRCKTKPFQAIARVRGRSTHIGNFATPEEAQEARKWFLKTIVR